MSIINRPDGDVPPVIRAAHVRRTPEQAFALFTGSIGAWWPLGSHGLFGPDGTVGFEGDRLVERSPSGQESLWATVTVWEPPHRLVLEWHPGRPPEEAGEVEVTFSGDEDGTRVELQHRGWERFGPDAARRRSSYEGPSAWGAVLDHFTHLADATGPRSARVAAGLAELAAASERFFAEAERGGFGPPPAGEWDAATTVAHVALNDLALAGVGRRLIDRQQVSFDNVTCQDPAALKALVAAFVDLPALVAFGREQAAAARGVAARLDEDQAATLVPCRLLHDGEVVLDEALPWAQVAVDLQATRHLPAHLEQLRSLRP